MALTDNFINKEDKFEEQNNMIVDVNDFLDKDTIKVGIAPFLNDSAHLKIGKVSEFAMLMQ